MVCLFLWLYCFIVIKNDVKKMTMTIRNAPFDKKSFPAVFFPFFVRPRPVLTNDVYHVIRWERNHHLHLLLSSPHYQTIAITSTTIPTTTITLIATTIPGWTTCAWRRATRRATCASARRTTATQRQRISQKSWQFYCPLFLPTNNGWSWILSLELESVFNNFLIAGRCFFGWLPIWLVVATWFMKKCNKRDVKVILEIVWIQFWLNYLPLHPPD